MKVLRKYVDHCSNCGESVAVMDVILYREDEPILFSGLEEDEMEITLTVSKRDWIEGAGLCDLCDRMLDGIAPGY